MSNLDDAITTGQQSFANSKAVAENIAREASLRSKPREEITLLIEGKEVPIISANISRSIDTMADSWTCDLEWIPGRDRGLDDRLSPKTYCKSQIYIGSRLVNTGRLYYPKTNFGEQGVTKHLEFWSYTADLVDSALDPTARFEWNNSSLYEIASGLCRQMNAKPPITVGISRSMIDNRANWKFDIVQAGITETYADFFAKLAFEHGMLVTNDAKGMMLITMGARKGPVVASLGEQEIAAYAKNLSSVSAKSQGWSFGVDGRKQFGTYAVYGQSGYPLENKDSAGEEFIISSEATDVRVPPWRRTNIIVSDNTAANIQNTAAWHRSRKLIEALTLPFPVIGYYTPQGELWNPNDFVIVKAPSLDINVATKLLVRQIDYEYSAAGETGTLYLVPPEVYTGEPVREPWTGRWT